MIRFYPTLTNTIEKLIRNFDSIPLQRKELLNELTAFIEAKRKKKEKIELIFICTHNSRRSHISQVWGQAAAAYYGIENVYSFSGGTEATAFNPRAVKAMGDAGFKVVATTEGSNPVYRVTFADNGNDVMAFSKKYDSPSNPQNGFVAIMTCSHADDNCPVVAGMDKRISLPYNDPKDFDGTEHEAAKYAERVHEIGLEILYAFSRVKS